MKSHSLHAGGAVLVPLLLMMSLLVPNVSGQDIVFKEVGPMGQECPAPSTIQYSWFLYNSLPSSFLLEVRAEPASGAGWDSNLNREITVLHPGESVIINMSVSASGDVTSKVVSQTVTFVLTNLESTGEVHTHTSVAETEFIPTWGVIAPGKNKLLGRYDNPLPDPWNGNYVTFALNIGIWAGIALAFAYVINPAIHLFTKKTKADFDDRMLKILHKPIFALVIIYGLVSSFSILQLTDEEVRILFQIYGIFMIAIVTFIAYKIFKEILVTVGRRWASRTATEIDDVLIPVIDKVGGLVILVFGAIGAVNYLGYDVTFLLAGVGVFGLVIAFAAQDALSNFFSGVFLLLDRPFAEGDHVQLASGELCRVEKIGIRSTRLYDVMENDYVILPNNKLVNDKIVNLNEPDDLGKVEVSVGVAYGTDIKKVENILLKAAQDHAEVLKDPGREPVVRFASFGESALEIKMFVWVGSFMDKWRVGHELRKEVYERFAREGIEIPYPQRTVYIKEMPRQK